MASVYPTAINLCETYIDVTGAAATSFVFGSSVGQMSMPLIIGLLFDTALGPMSLIYVMIVIVVTANAFFFLMWEVGAKNPNSKVQIALRLKEAEQRSKDESAEVVIQKH